MRISVKKLNLAGFVVLAGMFPFLIAPESAAQVIPVDSGRWEINARESKVVNHLGRKALYLKGGRATVNDSKFEDGIIEFDLAVTGQRGFMGAVWRWQDAGNYEDFYIRPHQSGLPDANQYQPVFNGGASWQLYHGKRYGTAIKYDFDKWMRIKIVVSGRNAEIYIRDMGKPVLFVNELKHGLKTGRVGLSASNFAPGYFSNFKFVPLKRPKLKGSASAPKPVPAGTVMNWMVSEPFAAKLLEKTYSLSGSAKQRSEWKTIRVEDGGFANLSRLSGISEGKNTVFARLFINSEKKQIKKFKFGYSDNAKVYFNNRLIYGGTNLYQSRDYRYLGTIGLFDEVYLPLNKGKNEIWIAVTENFGGWGVQGFFDDMNGIQLIGAVQKSKSL